MSLLNAQSILDTLVLQKVPDKCIYLLSVAHTIPSSNLWLFSLLRLVRTLVDVDSARHALIVGRVSAILGQLTSTSSSLVLEDREARLIGNILRAIGGYAKYTPSSLERGSRMSTSSSHSLSRTPSSAHD